ncbi:heparan sulfate glucosamine 3-O-sulfotransferase 6 [Cherax quadricarinatus]|uniref:heparan sulfate glucosamine 3-O-sulfotransferase 6 n=1 Tax=Cherax quadricarinatus TaxID=27406 RepID=UPI0023792DC8|nr:heparan sulfate glucosamine 3-O-sulfotransferase 6-like [Cherax quadricarinatus]
MHLPRRLCSLLGGVFVLFFCFFCVADYYGYHYYYYSSTAILSEAYPPALPQVRTPTHGTPTPTHLFNDTTDSLWVAPHHHPDARYTKEKKRQCKKKYWKCNKLPTDPEPPLEMFEEGGEGGGARYNSTFETNSLEDTPLWNQFADRGYTVLGTNGSAAARRLPDVLIIGAKKSGTRALLAFLRVHPSIRASGPEIHYFDRFYSRGLSWYRSQLPLSLEGQLTVEKTPAYFTTPGVPERVKDDLPNAKLLLVVRNPVTRALSDYTQGLSKHRSRRSFEELTFVRWSSGLVNSEWGPISGGLYARHLKRWLDHFPRSSIHVVSGENLIMDPAAELCKVQEFLGLRRVITEKHFFFNATKGFPCLVKREKTGRPHCLGSSKGRSHPPVSQTTYNILRDFYRPFNFKFYKMVGHNFHW